MITNRAVRRNTRLICCLGRLQINPTRMQAPKHSIKMTIHYQLFNELSNSHLATHWCVQWDHQKIHGQKEFWIAYLTPHLFYIREHFHSLLIDKAQQLTRMSANQSNSCEETLTSKVSVAVVLYCFQYRSVLLSMLFYFFLYDILLLLCHIFKRNFICRGSLQVAKHPMLWKIFTPSVATASLHQ